jgi:hypothetical protein
MARMPPQAGIPANPQQTAEYTYQMLVALKDIASDHGQETLVALLAAAAAEARSLARLPANGGEA